MIIGILSAEEIANASASLKKLDKDGDGKISREEMRPAGRDHAGKGGPELRRPRCRSCR